MQTITTCLEATALALILTAVVLLFVPSQYVVPSLMAGNAVALLVLSWGLSRVPPKASP